MELSVFSVGKVKFDHELMIKNKLGKKPTKFVPSLSEFASILLNMYHENQTNPIETVQVFLESQIAS